MPALIVPAGSINLAAVGAPKAVVSVATPAQPIVGAPTNKLGLVGTASWGPVHVATIVGGNTDGQAFFGPPQVRAHDVATAIEVAVQQGCNAMVVVRVSDGSDAAATSTYPTNQTAETVTIAGTATAGDEVIITATPQSGTPVNITYTVQSADTPTTIAAGLLAAFRTTALPAAGLAATVASAVLTIHFPSGQWTFTDSVTGSASESVTLNSATAPVVNLTLTARYTGTVGNLIKGYLQSGTKAGSMKVVIARPGYVPEVFDNITGTGNNLWANAAAAINNGNSVVRGPSQLVIATAGAGIDTVPTSTQTISLAGGADGVAGIEDTDLLGVDSSPRTGLYALRNAGCGVITLIDVYDSTTWSAVDAFALPEGALCYLATQPNDTVTAAIDELATAGIDDWPLAICFGDWLYWWDGYNGTQRLLSPATFVAAKRAALSPEQSVLNKQLRGIVGSQKSNSGGIWAQADIDAIYVARLEFVTNPVPGGYYWGSSGGINTSSNAADNGDNYTMMTNFLARSLQGWAGSNVGALQTPSQRGDVIAAGNNFLNGLWKLGMIGNADSANGVGAPPWDIQCNDQTTPPAMAALGYEIAAIRVQYLSVIRWFVANLIGGQTVTIAVSNTAPSFATQGVRA